MNKKVIDSLTKIIFAQLIVDIIKYRIIPENFKKSDWRIYHKEILDQMIGVCIEEGMI